ncbi:MULTISPECIES: 3'-5' exonuclease [Mammaliicoccus]|uniref:3'-5' exonuclease n=6 Tax=Mammaliicoccus sciuri TaxID=1296 RepID=A0AAW5LML6_MAMSC|nr:MULTISPECIES: 3'-5' exonuclease [Mammaliicoccus]MBG9210474.1 3'-5' exonuclease [Mammaliicoccus sciuri]MCD5141670.1 3'-5' exonuclease [Mammaliicoccus sciuri]MCD8881147.1 3'-5' exonuclease [Mammaliicoccus sciuri]MCI8456635.1 3'-5' exonuclease [Mammaliicoccus sciuri]MCQ9303392.1 3'-5' exonuclease [Mammaliicoccus sciuri]
MEAKKTDKMLFQSKFPEVEVLLESEASTKIDKEYIIGSIFVTIQEIILVQHKENLTFQIPWSEVVSLDTKLNFISSKLILDYGENRMLIFSFSSSDPVHAIQVFYKTLKLEREINHFNNDDIKALQHQNEQLIKENFKLRNEIIKLNEENRALLDNMHNQKSYTPPYRVQRRTYDRSNNSMDLSYTKVRKLTDSFIVLDFETTGLKYNENEIIQCGIIEYEDGKIISEYNEYFKPSKPISKRIEKITGISNEFLEDKPSLGKDKLEELYNIIRRRTIVAHNAPFDMKFLLYQLQINNIEYEKLRVIDTLTFSRKLIRETPNHKLQTLKEHFNLDDAESHNAINDCRATGNLLLLLMSRQ